MNLTYVYAAMDGDGNLVNWWTDADRAEFEDRTRGLVRRPSERSIWSSSPWVCGARSRIVPMP